MPPSLEAAAREKARLDAVHHKKLSEMKSSIDTRTPPSFKHLSPESGKGASLAAARQVEIDKGNARLLHNLTRIASGGASMDLANGERPLNRGEAPHNPPKSLAEKSRRIEQQRIDDENQRILKNITSVSTGGAYSPAAMQADYELHKQRRDRIARYPGPN